MPNYVTFSLGKAQVGNRSKIPETSDKWRLVDRQIEYNDSNFKLQCVFQIYQPNFLEWKASSSLISDCFLLVFFFYLN